ncbi:hypothetical protein POUND7_008614 [Theobroma cacao]
MDPSPEVKLPQVTAEQILLESREQQEAEIRAPKQKLTNSIELLEYHLLKFEDEISRESWNIGAWINYAKWRESLKDFMGARIVWHRAMKVNDQNCSLWLNYAKFEMKNKFFNHTRDVWNRAVTVLPHVDVLWHKYIHMEEMLGNIGRARQIFERWMSWMPNQRVWLSYIDFELRCNEVVYACLIYERFIECHPKVGAWITYAKFEMRNGEIVRARNVYEQATEKLADEEDVEPLFIAFAEFEEQCKETERARRIYKSALDHIPKGRAENLYGKFVAFEKQYGDKEGIEDAIGGKNPLNYDGGAVSYEEYIDYVFPEEKQSMNLKILEAAFKWKKHRISSDED